MNSEQKSSFTGIKKLLLFNHIFQILNCFIFILVYQIITPPKQGVLLLSSSRHDVMSRSTDAKLRQGSTFNQVDLLSGHLKYRLTAMNIKKSLDDTFTFKVGVNSETGKSNIQVRLMLFL